MHPEISVVMPLAEVDLVPWSGDVIIAVLKIRNVGPGPCPHCGRDLEAPGITVSVPLGRNDVRRLKERIREVESRWMAKEIKQ